MTLTLILWLAFNAAVPATLWLCSRARFCFHDPEAGDGQGVGEGRDVFHIGRVV